jgi:hypothetical protein
MAKSDSSAVQKLIELANQKPLELDVDLDGLFADDGRKAKPALPPPRRSANAPMSPSQTVPPLPRTRAPVSTQTGFAAVSAPAADPAIAPSRPAPRPRLGAPTVTPTIEPVSYADLASDGGDVPATQQTPRRGSVAPWILAGAFALGVGFAAVYIVAEGLGGAAPRPDQAIAPAPVVAPVAAPSDLQPSDQAPAPVAAAPAAPTAAATATVGFVSTPPGATVVLVDNGTMTPLGKTPLTAPLVVGKKHEVLFTLEGRGTVLAHVDPATQTSVAVELGAGAEAVAAAAPAEPVAAPAAPEPARESRSERRARSERKPEKRVAAREPAGKGTLMLGAKPPCEIIIDGKATGLITPQREIPLAAGRHTVTLVNKQHGIRKSFPITVGAGGSVKVVKDFTDLMK